MHCGNWYAITRADQCDIGGRELRETNPDTIGFDAVKRESIYGHPSILNKDNDCSHYKGIGFARKLFRRLVWDIPMRPTLDSKIDKDLQPN